MNITVKKILAHVNVLLGIGAMICIFFPFFELSDGYVSSIFGSQIYGYDMYLASKINIFVAVLGAIVLLYDCFISAYFLIEKKEGVLINKMMGYGAYFGALIGIVNLLFWFANDYPWDPDAVAAYIVFTIFVLAVIAIKLAIVFTKPTPCQSKNEPDIIL